MQVPEGFIPYREARKYLGASTNTLRLWAEHGEIECVKLGTKLCHRFYNVKGFLETHTNKPKPEEKLSQTRRKICYCRVSSRGQKDDLERQVNFLKLRFPTHEIIKDIGSGLNFKRKGLQKLLQCAYKGEIEELVVAHKDRLCRFGFEIFKYIIEELSNGKVVVLDDCKSSPEAELVADVLSILNVFSARVNGLRKYKTKIKQELTPTQVPETEGQDPESGRDRTGGDEITEKGSSNTSEEPENSNQQVHSNEEIPPASE